MPVLNTPRRRVQHLLRRAGFGYRADELEEYVALGLEGAVERLLHPESVDDATCDTTLDAFNVDLGVKEQRNALWQLWHLRLLLSRRPLLEKMTYFWHGHFATALSKVGEVQWMHDQNQTLRRLALGSFEELLLAVARDRAMLAYLDNRSNTKGAPNENYARELLELHTLGHGAGYTEGDVKEAARALTGWRIVDGKVELRAQQHDAGVKTILGKTENFDDTGLMKLLAAHPATASHLASKLCTFFVMPDPPLSLVERVASMYTLSGGSIREVLRSILLSEEMYSDAAYRSLVKSPTEVVIGAERAFEFASDGRGEVDIARRMGQVLYEPPNPAGWPGGRAWINASTMLARANFANDLTLTKGARAVDVPALLRQHGATGSAAAVVDWLLDLLVGGDVDVDTHEVLVQHLGGADHFNFEQATRDGLLHGAAYLALSMPLYQLA